MSKDPSLWSALRRKLRKQGFTLRLTGSMHYKVYDPQGKLVSTMPSSPGGGRAYLNQVSQLRKAGANL